MGLSVSLDWGSWQEVTVSVQRTVNHYVKHDQHSLESLLNRSLFVLSRGDQLLYLLIITATSYFKHLKTYSLCRV